MRRLVIATALAAAALTAVPALALTVSPTPTQEQAARLKLQQSRGAANGSTDLRDTFAGSGRPLAGDDFYGSQGDYRRTQTFSFGNVTTTVTTGRDNSLPSFLDQDPRRATRFGNDPRDTDLIGRRR